MEVLLTILIFSMPVFIIIFYFYVHYDYYRYKKHKYDEIDIPLDTYMHQTNQQANNTPLGRRKNYNAAPPAPQPYSNIAETNTAEKDVVTKQEYEFNYDYSYMPYRKKYLLTKTENSFFLILIRQALLRGLLVCPKVRLEDVAFVYDKRQERKYRGYVKSRHIDFVLINAKGDTIAGIELDDPSHDTEEAKKTDHFKDELFKTIKVPLIRIKTGTDYTAQLNTVFDNLNFTLVDQKKPLIVPDNVQAVKTTP